MKGKPAIVVVAGGRGLRHSGAQHKLLESLGSTHVLGMTLRNAVATHLPLVVVTTEGLVAEVAGTVALRDVVVVPEVRPKSAARGPAGELGMGYSIAAGVVARCDAAGWLVLPADMPLIQPASILAVAAALEDHAVAYAQHRGLRGHPVAFSQELYSELAALVGDDGAKRIVARYPGHAVEVPDAGVRIDIDTEDDLRAVRATLARAGP
jgi:molybdenum cofactor cytidylyltransferase